MTLQELLQEARALSVEERKQLIKLLVDIVTEPSQETRTQKRSLKELRGLGKDIWAGIDA